MTVDYACGTINRIGLDSASTPIARLRLLYFSYPAFVVIARTPPPIYRFSMKARTVGDCSSAVRKGIAEFVAVKFNGRACVGGSINLSQGGSLVSRRGTSGASSLGPDKRRAPHICRSVCVMGS